MKKSASKKDRVSPVFQAWVDATRDYKPQKLEENECAQFEKSKIYEEQSRSFNFVLGGRVNFNF